MRTIKVVQIGGLRCDLSDTLAPEFKYYWIANDRVVDADNKLAPFEDGRLKPGFRTAIFLIAPGSRLLDDTELVAQLPAYQVIYDEHLVLAPDIEALLDVKAAQAMALLQPETVAHAINDDYFGGQTGYKLNFDEVRITPNFTGQVRQEGHNRMLYTGSFGQQPQQLLNWRQRGFVMTDYQVTVLPEAAVLSGDVTISFKFYLVDRDTNQVNKVIEKTFNDLQEPFQLPQSDKVQFVYVTVWAQGTGQISIGNCHFRRSRRQRGELMPGGVRVVDQAKMRTELLVYFNPGDMKPPLNIYFSGYRTAEGFEGAFMMQGLGSPFLLIGDPRLEGGGFYMGSAQLEADLVKTIDGYLDQLGFTHDQLILSGLSMGTYGALYYAAKLKPYAVIVGKPLVDLGTMAENERINRPGGFPTSLDNLLWHTGRADSRGVTELNRHFWAQFNTGDFENTTFAISYMKEDDYDQTAFQELFRTLKHRFPNVKLLYKGLTGRHNDDTNGIVTWFLDQYHNLLHTGFGRQVD